MKNKDVLAMEKAKIVEKMNQAIKDDDTKAFSEAFTELCQKIEDNVLEQAKEMLVEQDATILAQRGVRQLTSKEKQYYEKIIEAMRSTDPKQALNDVEVVMPETIIDSVFDELQTNHPLLSKLNATTVTGLTRMMMNTNGEQKAAWGKLTAKIIEELTSGFKEVDVTQEKLSAFLPVSKAMLDLGPTWLDTYVRQVLYEALANGLEYGIVQGTGKDEPIGMMKQVGEGVVVTGGKYPDKNAIKMTALDMTQMGNVTAIMARNDKGQARTVTSLILLVNPVDYFRRVLPATGMESMHLCSRWTLKSFRAQLFRREKQYMEWQPSISWESEWQKMEKLNILTNTDSWKMRGYISSSCMRMVSHWITMLSRFWISRISSRYVLRL